MNLNVHLPSDGLFKKQTFKRVFSLLYRHGLDTNKLFKEDTNKVFVRLHLSSLHF